MIKNVKTVGLKGKDWDLDLAPVTILCGEPFSGKTTLLDGIQLGLLGYHPEVGKKPQELFKLANGDRMGMTLDTTAGTFQREWRLKKGTVSKKVDLQPVEVPPVSLDLQAFLGMKEADRVQYLLTKAGVSGLKKEAVLKAFDVGDHDEVKKLKEEAEALWKNRQSDLAYLVALVESVTAKDSALKHQRDTMAAVAQGTVQQMAEDFKLPEGAEDLDQAVKVLQAGVDRIEARLAEIASGEAMAKWKQAKSLKAQVDELEPVEVLKEEKANLEKQLQAMKLAEVLDASGDPDALEHEEGLARDVSYSEQSKVDALLGQLKAVQEKIKAVDGWECCPACNASQDGWKQAVLTSLQKEEEALKVGLAAAEAKAAVATKKVDLIRERLNKWDAEHAARLKWEAGRDGLADALTKVDHDLGTHEALQLKLKALGEVSDPADPALASGLEEAKAALAKAQGARMQRDAAKADQRRIEQAKQKAEELEGALELVREIAANLKEMNRALMVHAGGRLCQNARRLTDGILKGKLDFQAGEFGMELPDGRWVSHKAMSGTEKLLSYAGLCVALASDSPLKVALVDDLGRTSGFIKAELVARALQLIQEGFIAQMIGTDTAVEDWDGDEAWLADAESRGLRIVKLSPVSAG